MKKNRALRQLLAQEKMIAVPGCFECVSAKVIEQMGFPAVYLTGSGSEASKLGRPDMGIITMTEHAELAGNIANAVNIPLICDIDTGYGGLNNVYRTIQTFEQKGISGVHMEDQVFPKSCPGLAGVYNKNISIEEMQLKIKTALRARQDPDFLLIARSDAKESESFDSVLKRLDKYLEAGADLVMASTLFTEKEYETLGREFTGKMVICAGSPGLTTQNFSLDVYEEMGMKIVIYPCTALFAASKAVRDIYTPLQERRRITDEELDANCISLEEYGNLMEIERYAAINSGAFVSE